MTVSFNACIPRRTCFPHPSLDTSPFQRQVVKSTQQAVQGLASQIIINDITDHTLPGRIILVGTQIFHADTDYGDEFSDPRVAHGFMGWLYKKPRKIEKSYHELVELLGIYTQQIDKLNKRKEEIHRLYNTSSVPEHLEGWLAYETLFQSQRIKLLKAAEVLQQTMNAVHKETGPSKLLKYLNADYINMSYWNQLNYLHETVQKRMKETGDICVICSQSIELSTKNMRYAQQFLTVLPLRQEFLELYASIYDPNKTEEERRSTEARIDIAKSTLDLQLKSLADLRHSAQINVGVDSSSMQQEADDLWDKAHFFCQSENETLEELDMLLKAQPQEYLHKASLYQSKLKMLGQWDRVADHVRKWLKTVPQEAQSIDVRSMVESFIQVGGMRNGAHRLEVQDALTTWLVSHPNLSLDEMALGQGNLGYLNEDTSLEAMDYYRRCEVLQPDRPEWKTMQVLFDVATLQWTKAREQLPSLSESAAALVQFRISESQYKTYAFAVDTFHWMFVNAIGPALREKVCHRKWATVSLDIIETGMHLVSDPILKDACISRFAIDTLIHPQQTSCPLATFFLASSITQIMMKPTFDFISTARPTRLWYHNQIERPISCGLEITVPTIRLWSLLTGTTEWSVGMAASLGSSFLSLVPKLEGVEGNWLTPDRRAILRTVQKISNDLLPLDLVCRGGGLLTSVGKRYISQSTISAFCGEGNKIFPNLSGGQMVLAQLTLSAAYRVLFDSPKIRAVCVMEEMRKLSSQGNLQKARQVVAESHSWCIGDVETVKKYGACLDIFGLVSILNTPTNETRQTINEIMPRVNQALRALQCNPYYSDIRNDLVYNEIIVYLACGSPANYLAAKNILVEEKTNVTVYAKVILFLVEQTEMRVPQSYDIAENYLQQAQEIFAVPVYNQIIIAYKQYIFNRKRCPILTPESPIREVEQKIQVIDSAKALLQAIEPLSQLDESLLYDKFVIYVRTKKYEAAVLLMDSLHSDVSTQFFHELVDETEALCKQGQYDAALVTLQKVHSRVTALSWLNFRLRTYQKYIASRKRHPVLTAASPKAVIEEQLYLLWQFSITLHSDLFATFTLLYLKLCVETKTYNKVMHVLFVIRQENHARFIFHLNEFLENLCAEGQYDKALEHLKALDYKTLSKSIIPHEQNTGAVIRAYEKYVSCWQQHPILTVVSSNEVIIERTCAIDAILQLIEQQQEYSQLSFHLQYNKAILFIDTKKYSELLIFLNMNTFNPKIHDLILNHIARKADALVQQDKYDEAITYLTEAKNALEDRYSRFLQQYIIYVTSYKSDPAVSETVALTQAVSILIERTHLIPEMLWLHSQMEATQLYLHIKGREYSSAVIILTKKHDLQLHTFTANLLLQSAHKFMIQNLQDEAEAYLREALQALRECIDIEIIRKYQAYMLSDKEKHTSPEKKIVWMGAVDSLITDIQEIGSMSWLHEHLLINKFSVLIQEKSYQQAKIIFDSPNISAQSRQYLMDRIAFYLIHEGEMLISIQGIKAASTQLHRLAEDFGLLEHNVLRKYFEVIGNFIRLVPEEKSVHFLIKTLNSVQRLIEELELIQVSIPPSLNGKMIQLCLLIGSIEQSSPHRTQNAIEAYLKAKILLLKEAETNRGVMIQIDHMIGLLNTTIT